MSKIERALKKMEEERQGMAASALPNAGMKSVVLAGDTVAGVRHEVILPLFFSEWFRKIAVRLKYGCDQIGATDVLFTSASGGEGKTTSAFNCAISLCHDYNLSVCLVDVDLRRPGLSTYFDTNGELTLIDHLKGEAEMDSVICATSIQGLYVVQSPAVGRLSLSFLNTTRLARLITELKSRFDLVIFDSPPILPVADTAVLARNISAVAFVIECGKTRRRHVHQALEQIGSEKMVGFIVNNKKSRAPDPYARAVYYDYGSTEERKSTDRITDGSK
jgi:capsular exopolysaccharide synthesis family protein